jgi:RNA polymerase sigma-70 factor (ECF subfamily)
MIDRRRLWDGDPEYFALLIREHGRAVKAVCLSFAESEADVDDLLQEVWTLIFWKRRSHRGEGSFAAWAHRVAKRHCIDVYRKRASERSGLERLVRKGGVRDFHGRNPTPEQELDRRETERTVWEALDALPEREREAIVLRLIEGRSPAEVSQQMKIDKASVRSNISRGIKRMRGMIG